MLREPYTLLVKCIECGRFISSDDMVTGEALFHFEPESDRDHERCEWTCKRCVLPRTPPASVDTHRDSGGDATQIAAPSPMSGAVLSDSEADAQPPSPSPPESN